MKNLFLILILFLISFNQAFAIRALSDKDYEQFEKSLHLNIFQKIKIKEIKEKCSKEQEVYYIELRNNISNDRRKELQKKLYELKQKQDNDIIQILNESQKRKYIEFNSREY